MKSADSSASVADVTADMRERLANKGLQWVDEAP
jgi:hypothetical protein